MRNIKNTFAWNRFHVSLLSVILIASIAIVGSMVGCGGKGDTGNDGDPNVNLGNPYVSNGASGSTMTIELEGGGNEIGVTRQVDFKVTALDPSGLPLSHIRLFCESESGIAIIEPSSGGVAFEHTNANGVMSGVLGGLSPGSFLLECRAPQGFNLVARKSFKVTGEIPEGFDGFPGAAGGNLGGGVLVDPPAGEDVELVEILFSSVTESTPIRVANIDLSQITNCNLDPAVTVPELETWGVDNYHITIRNNLDQRISVSSVTISGPGANADQSPGATVSSTQQLGGLIIQANSEVEFVGPLTQASSFATPTDKVYAGTSHSIPRGTFNLTFRVSVETMTGQTLTGTQIATVRGDHFFYCGGGF